MDVKDLCLGTLTFGEASGYDLKKFFENTFSHCFLAGYGSIYPALAELTAEKLVTARSVRGQGGPSRKLYHLTETGHQAFLACLRDTAPQHKVKSEFLVLMYFAHLLPAKRLDAILDQHLQDIEHKLGLMHIHEVCPAGSSAQSVSGARFVSGFGKAVMTAASDYIRNYRLRLQSSGKESCSSMHQTRACHKPAQIASRNY